MKDENDFVCNNGTIDLPRNKSKMFLTNNFVIMTTIKYNRFQKWLWKICFNVIVKDVEGDE